MDYKEKQIRFLGFEFERKKFFNFVMMYVAVIAVFVLLDAFLYDVSWYGVIISSGFLVATILAGELMPKRNIDTDFVYFAVLIILPFSIIGARIAYVINYTDVYTTFYSIIAVWNGGLSIYGGVVGGTLGLLVACLIKKVKFVDSMDCIAPVLILAQAIGRWGNFVNQEVYGKEIVNKAFQWFPVAVKVNDVYYMATFFYESILNLAGFMLLVYLFRKLNIKGLVVSCYLIFYGFVRLVLESLRVEEFIMMIPGTKIQWSSMFSCFYILIGAVALTVSIIMHKKHSLRIEE